jgi:hypothetical protein
MKKLNVFLLMCLLGLLSINPVWAEEVFPQGEGRYVTKEIQIKTVVSSNDKIIINSTAGLSGKLYIAADSTSQAIFEYKKILKTSSRSEATDYAGTINVSMEETPEGIRILLQTPNPAPWAGSDNSGALEGDLHLPVNCNIEITAPYFDLVIDGPFKAVKSQSSFGRIEVQKITEKLTLAATNQDIVARDIQGDISLTAGNADIRVDNLHSGDKAARIRNESGGIFLNQVSGAINVENSFGKIRLDELSLSGNDNRIIGSYAPIKIQVIELKNADILISNTNEDIELRVEESVSSDFSLTVDSGGEIDAEGFKMLPKRMDSNRMQFTSGKGGSLITINIAGEGNIFVRGVPAP